MRWLAVALVLALSTAARADADPRGARARSYAAGGTALTIIGSLAVAAAVVAVAALGPACADGRPGCQWVPLAVAAGSAAAGAAALSTGIPLLFAARALRRDIVLAPLVGGGGAGAALRVRF